MHAIGLDEHPDPDEYPDSVLAYSFRWNPDDVLYRIDRDVLAASHTIIGRQLDRTEMAEALGAWNETSNLLMTSLAYGPGSAETVSYGARTSNGFAEGPTPVTNLSSNLTLSGTATWTGGLLGYTPDERGVAGDTALDRSSPRGDRATH